MWVDERGMAHSGVVANDLAGDIIDWVESGAAAGGGGGGAAAISYGEPVFDPLTNRYYQLDSRGQRHYLPAPVQTATGPRLTQIKGPDGTIWIADADTFELIKPLFPAAPKAPDPVETTNRTLPDGSVEIWRRDPATGKVELIQTLPPTKPTQPQNFGGGAIDPNIAAVLKVIADREAQQGAALSDQERLRQQQEFTAGENAKDRAQRAAELASAERQRADDRRLQARAALADAISAIDPAEYDSFLLAGGGNIMNALATGATAVSERSLNAAANLLQEARGGLQLPPAGGTTPPGSSPPTGTPPGTPPMPAGRAGRMPAPRALPAINPATGMYETGGYTGVVNTDPLMQNEGNQLRAMLMPGQPPPAGANGWVADTYDPATGKHTANVVYDYDTGRWVPVKDVAPTAPAAPPEAPPPPPAPGYPIDKVPRGVTTVIDLPGDTPLDDFDPSVFVYGADGTPMQRGTGAVVKAGKVTLVRKARGGLTREAMMMTGDAPDRDPWEGGAQPEVIYNPTRAPIAVFNSHQTREMMRRRPRGGLTRYALGTVPGFTMPITTVPAMPLPRAIWASRNGYSYAQALTPAGQAAYAAYLRAFAAPAAGTAPPPAGTPPAAGGGLQLPPAPTPGGTTTPPAATNPPPPTSTGTTGLDALLNPMAPGNLVNEIRDYRAGIAAGEFNPYAVDYFEQDPTIRARREAQFKIKYGLPEASQQAEAARYRLNRAGRGGLQLAS